MYKMKREVIKFYGIAFIVLLSCGNSNGDNKIADNPVNANATAPTSEIQQGGIAGEWEQQYTCFDKNGNYKLEPEEKKPSNTRLGFNWFRFNKDGSCLRDKDVQFKGTYTIQEKNGNRDLVIEGGDNLRYSIAELTEKELVLGADGAFIVFKRIK
jgi:hypothetical protein